QMRAFLMSDWRSGFARLCDGRASCGHVLLIYVLSVLNCAGQRGCELREGALSKLSCKPAGKQGCVLLGQGAYAPRSGRGGGRVVLSSSTEGQGPLIFR
ncbi:MAG: hypothetical protein JWP89_3157, partial [Schlesneria sp.]|nr:hypothetical protein [Schlesneria sp.]